MNKNKDLKIIASKIISDFDAMNRSKGLLLDSVIPDESLTESEAGFIRECLDNAEIDSDYIKKSSGDNFSISKDGEPFATNAKSTLDVSKSMEENMKMAERLRESIMKILDKLFNNKPSSEISM